MFHEFSHQYLMRTAYKDLPIEMLQGFQKSTLTHVIKQQQLLREMCTLIFILVKII